MKSSFAFTFVYFYALLSSGFTSKEDERAEFDAILQLIEMDFGEFCQKIADATWSELVNGRKKDLSNKLERDKAFGIFSQVQANETNTHYTPRVLHADRDVLRRKARLLMRPADHMLPPDGWIRLVTFADTAFHKIRYSKNYDCGTNTTCSYREVHNVYNISVLESKSCAGWDFPLATSPKDKYDIWSHRHRVPYFSSCDEEKDCLELQNHLTKENDEESLEIMKRSWEKHLPDINEYREKILPLLKTAAHGSNYTTVEEYWSMLLEYEHESFIIKARELWDQVKPLYVKLHRYVALRLRGSEAVGQTLPSYLIRSFPGDDWSNLISFLLPKHPDIYHKIYANLHLKELGGQNALKEASRFLSDLRLDELPSEVLEQSSFNSSCPPVLVDWCLPNNKNKIRVVSCSDVGLQHYLDAHEVAMRVKHRQVASLHSNNTYILREASRYSAVYEAIPGFASLLALNPHALKRAGLFPIDRFTHNPNYHRIVLQLVTALRDLPRLNFYLAADEWRLNYIRSFGNNNTSWSDFRRQFSLMEESDVDLLGEPDVLYNKPLIGKFMGIILKYQIYQGYAEELASDEESDLIQHVAENNDRIYEAMMQGYSVPWPELVSGLLATREQALDHTGLTDYYKLLDDYLDHQLDLPGENNEGIDYEELVTSTKEPEPAENEIPDEPLPENKDEIHNIAANYEEDPSIKGTETSTVGVLEIKKPVTTGDLDRQETKAASYSTYWWIGIVVAVMIVIVFIAIIARKRQSHRKQLERQRRQSNHA